jgi:hypothetical protein
MDATASSVVRAFQRHSQNSKNREAGIFWKYLLEQKLVTLMLHFYNSRDDVSFVSSLCGLVLCDGLVSKASPTRSTWNGQLCKTHRLMHHGAELAPGAHCEAC